MYKTLWVVIVCTVLSFLVLVVAVVLGAISLFWVELLPTVTWLSIAAIALVMTGVLFYLGRQIVRWAFSRPPTL